MEYRKFGKTGWNVSVMGYGSSPLGGVFGRVDEKDGIKTVRTALDLGINFIDVSPYYGLTNAEVLLGKALKGISRERYYLATKVGRYGPKEIDFSRTRIQRSVDESLRRLKVAHIDLIQCHDIEYATLDQILHETLPTLETLKQQGKVRKIGITGLPLAVFRKILDRTLVDAVHSYCHYCLNDITLVQVLPYLKSKGVGIINAAPLAMGLLTEKGPPAWHPAPKVIRDTCAKAAAQCRKRRTNLAQLALQFALANPNIAVTIVGTASPKKIRDNVRLLGKELNQSVLAEVQEILAPIQNVSWPSGRPESN